MDLIVEFVLHLVCIYACAVVFLCRYRIFVNKDLYKDKRN